MPLHAERERARARTLTASTSPSGALASTTARAELRDASCSELTVARARDPLQQATRRELHDVRRAVLPFERIGGPLAVIVEAGGRVQPLMQRAAVGDVQLPHAATDRQHGHARVDRRTDQRQRGRVARGSCSVSGALAAPP